MWVTNLKGRLVEIPADMWADLEKKGFKKADPMEAEMLAKEPGAFARMPKLSIIVLAWNRLDMTKKCVKSIYENTRCIFEVIIVNNNSDDGTKEWADEMARNNPNFKVVHNDTNRGVAGGRNDGHKLVSGRYIAHFDNDCTVGEAWDDVVFNTLEADSRISIVGRLGTNFWWFKQDGMKWINGGADYNIQSDVVSGGAMIFKRSLLGEIGEFDEAMGEFWHEDSEWCLRANLAGHKIFAVPYPWEHEPHSTYKKVKGKKWFNSFQANLDYIRKKIKRDNILTFYRDYHGEDCMESLCICATQLINHLRKMGWLVIRKGTKFFSPKNFMICSGFLIEHKGKIYDWLHVENDVMTKNWEEPIKEIDYVLSPSKHCIDGFERSGVNKEKLLDLSPNGLDKNIFNHEIEPTDQFKDKFFIFANGAGQPRKGFDLLIEAYGKAFTKEDNVVLFIKDGGYGNMEYMREFIEKHNRNSDAPTLIYLHQRWTPEQLAAFYRRAAVGGCFINSHRAEAFGLTICEALACGCRVGTTGWGGNLDYCNDKNSTLFGYDLVPSTFHKNQVERYYGDDEKPEWAEPKVEDISKFMQKCYKQRYNVAKYNKIAQEIQERFDFYEVAKRYDKFFRNANKNS